MSVEMKVKTMSKVSTKIYSRYDLPPQSFCPLKEGSSVDKESAKFVDINFIVKRYIDSDGASGLPVRSDYNKPIYGDFSKNYTLSDCFALREEMFNLYNELSPSKKADFKNFNDFLVKVGNSSDDEFLSIFTHKEKSPETLTAPAGDLSPVETSGSVQQDSVSTQPVEA